MFNIRWLIENVFNEIVKLCKEIFRKNIESVNWLFLVICDRVLYKREKGGERC